MRTTAILIGVAASLSLCGEAFSQNALGDGRALDNNLRSGSGGRNDAGRDFQAELRFRNAIVTGNAAGGASFRGTVGYTAAEDFRGALGSNENFAFQRDSLFSGFALQGLRGLDALQRQNTFAIGGFVDPSAPVPIAIRSGAAATFGEIETTSDQASNLPISMYDPFSLQRGALRSTALGYTASVLSPRRLAAKENEQGVPVYTVASPLRGLAEQFTPDYPAARFEIPEAPQTGPGSPFETDEDESAVLERRPGQAPSDRVPGRIENAAEEDRLDNRIGGRLESDRPDYTRALEEFRASFEEANERAPAIDDEQPELNEADELISKWAKPVETSEEDSDVGGAGASSDEDADGVEADEKPYEKTLRELSERISRSRGKNEDGERFSPAEEERRQLMEDATQLIGKATPRIATLSRGGAGASTLFDRQMKKAQSLLADGTWFAAEESFSTALRLNPGDPMAAAGRVHAQLGAALFKSAATNLEQLLVVNPELISVKYEKALLPSSDRLDTIRELLREAAKRDSDFGRKSAMLLGYLGWQVGDEVDIRHAFRAIDRIDEATGTPPDPLHDVMRAIWMKN